MLIDRVKQLETDWKNIIIEWIDKNKELWDRMENYYGEEVALINYKLNQFINKKKVNNKFLNVLKTWTAPKLPINGDDVIKYKKINGKEIGVVLSKIERWWVKNCFLPTRKECLKKLKII